LVQNFAEVYSASASNQILIPYRREYAYTLKQLISICNIVVSSISMYRVEAIT
jgi:hypothetical protein